MPISLVTGGAGFVGSWVAEHLIAMGHTVLVLDDLSGGFRENVPPRSSFIEGSILDHELIDRLFGKYNFDYVYHLACYAAEGLSHFIKRFNYQNNLIGSVNLINASVNYGVKRFVFTSSIAVYGSAPTPFTEDMECNPEDSYGIAKLAIERELEISHKMFGLDYVIFRPHNVYGERQNIGDRYRNVVGIFMNQCLKGEPMTIFGDGEQQRAFTHVSDVAPLVAESALNRRALNQTFNIGAGSPCSVNELARVVAMEMGVNPKVLHLPVRDEVAVAFADHMKILRALPTTVPVPLSDGIGFMASWVRKHGSRESKEFENIEISKNLPPSWKGTVRAQH